MVEEIFVIITIGEKLEEEEIKFFSREIFTMIVGPNGIIKQDYVNNNKYNIDFFMLLINDK